MAAVIAAASSSAQLCASGKIGHVHNVKTLASPAVDATVCCPASCERCGGVDCWAQHGGLACCAAHVYSIGAPPCVTPSDTGCVLPEKLAASMPPETREDACIDVWTAAFPSEREDWQGRSCAFKVRWDQCDQFYASCQCSCGYCLPSRSSCDPNPQAAAIGAPAAQQPGPATLGSPPPAALLSRSPPPITTSQQMSQAAAQAAAAGVNKDNIVPLVATINALALLFCCLCIYVGRRIYLCGRKEADYAPVVGRNSSLGSNAQLLPQNGGSRRAAVASALLDDCDELDEDEEEFPVTAELSTEEALRRQLQKRKEMEADAKMIYGGKLAEEGGPSPRYDLPQGLEGDFGDEDDIGPDDSISVAWFKQHKPPAASRSAVAARAIPVTIEAPDGSRHAMDVELDGLKTTAELRRGMLQGYREMLGEELPAHALRVHARLVSGSSVLLLDETPLTKDVIDAVSFYVWAARDANANDTGLVPVVDAEPAFAPFRQREELKPTATVAQRKEVLLRGR